MNSAKYNHLVANCLIFYNVLEISRFLNKLIQEGHAVDEAAIAALSPYLTHHVNRFGHYCLDLERCPPAIDGDVVDVLTACEQLVYTLAYNFTINISATSRSLSNEARPTDRQNAIISAASVFASEPK